MQFLGKFSALIARILIAPLFILAGLGKLFNVAGTEQALAAVNLPAGLALPTGIFELIAGLFLLFGLFQRITAILLAGFCIVTALFFHNDFADPMQQASFLKNIALAGGLILLFAYGSMSASVDGWRRRYTRAKENPVVVEETRTVDGEPVKRVHY